MDIKELERKIKNLAEEINLNNLGEKLSLKNVLEELGKFKKTPGVYIFLKDDKVVYVGKAGESHGLESRINIQLKGDPTNSTLGKNIDEIENKNKCKERYNENCCKNERNPEKRKECCKNYKDKESKEIYKDCLNDLINKYVNGIQIIPTSTSLMASILEALLIYKYKSIGQAKYNKDEI